MRVHIGHKRSHVDLTRRYLSTFDRNAAWLQAHAAEVYPRYRGQCICIAGEALFVADLPEEVLTLAKAAHPDDDGYFLHYIPREKLARI
jgi:hypothetical protein